MTRIGPVWSISHTAKELLHLASITDMDYSPAYIDAPGASITTLVAFSTVDLITICRSLSAAYFHPGHLQICPTT